MGCGVCHCSSSKATSLIGFSRAAERNFGPRGKKFVWALWLVKSSLYSLYYAEACNELRGPFPRLSAWATQLRRIVATVASCWQYCDDLTDPGIEPQTSRTDSVRIATELTAGFPSVNGAQKSSDEQKKVIASTDVQISARNQKNIIAYGKARNFKRRGHNFHIFFKRIFFRQNKFEAD